MDIQTIFAIIFIILLSLLIYIKRKNLKIQKILYPFIYLVLYRTRLGLRFMDQIGKRHPKTVKYVSAFAVIIGFIGMVFISYELLKNIYTIFAMPEALPGVGLVLPVQVKGAFYVPFFYWVISIFILAVVHEMSHGIVARRYNIKIKSSGFAFLSILVPIIPAAFVEPDEKSLRKKPAMQQLSVFSAGPFSNIVLGFACLLLLSFVISPAASSMMESDGVRITGFVDGDYYADDAGIAAGEVIRNVGGQEIMKVEELSESLLEKKPGETVIVETDKGQREVLLSENPDDASLPYLGVTVAQNFRVKDSLSGYKPLISVFFWFSGLVFWLYLLNLGIGLFNLVPIGPVDGGRMLQVALHKFLPKEKADRTWKTVSFVFFAVVLVIILNSFIR